MATLYAMYCVKVRVGWLGVFLSINLSFLSNDALNYLLQWCDNLSESTPTEEQMETESFTEEDFSTECEYSVPTDEPEKVQQPCKSSSKPAAPAPLVNKQKESSAKQVAKEDASSSIEMKRILSSSNHYEALGFVRNKKIDVILLKKEYRKKVMLWFNYVKVLFVSEISNRTTRSNDLSQST